MASQLTLPAALRIDLEQVEAVILQRIESRSAVVKVAGKHLLESGGKRLRAAVTLLAAQLGTYDFARVLHAATAVELIHTASLVHDDLVDEAERRRGNVTVHQRWDHGVALMVGDYFFALSAGEMALAPDPRVITFFSQAVMTICEGELSPVMTTTPLETALEQYYYKSGAKTAALFEAGCKAGMASGNGSAEQIAALGQFGYDVGLAFQIIDDVLDYIGDETVTGKPIGGDLREGIITLPFIHAVHAGGGERLAAAIDTTDPDERQWALGEVQRLGIAPARAEAQRLVAKANDILQQFPAGTARDTMGAIAQYVLDRDK